jgi:ABC-type sugar transport system permease subunit
LLLVVPAALTALDSLVVPTGQTIVRSFQEGHGFLGEQSKSAGLQNYSELLGHSAFWKALAFSLSLAIVPVLVMLLVGPLLAAALDHAGTWPRRVGRVLLSLPLVVFSPVAVAIAWLAGQPDGGVATAFGQLRDAGPWSPTVPLITAAALFGFLCGLALLVFLPVMRGRAQGRPLTPAMVAVGSITVLAAIAVALQAFSLDMTLTSGRQLTLSTLQYRAAYQSFGFGVGAAVATLTGVMLGVLGVLATIIAVRTGLRLDLGPRDTDGPDAGRRPDGGSRAVIGVLALVAVVAIAVLCSWPWLSALFSTGHTPPLRPSAARVYANTWIPPLLSAIVSVGTALLAALGIGGLRPLGRNSEWLLLPFAPWLFVGTGPLSIADFKNIQDLGLLGHFVTLLPPILLSVPSLLVLTLFCRARSARWRAQPAGGTQSFARLVALPALPLAVLMGGVTVFFGANGLLWPLLVGQDNATQTAPIALLKQVSSYTGERDVPYGAATPLVIVVLALLLLGALQVLYLDRLVIITGPAGEPGDDIPAGTPMPAQQPQWSGPGGYGPPPGYPAQPGPYSPPPGVPGPPPAGYGPPSGYPAQPGGYGLPPGQPGGYGAPPGRPGQSGGYGPPPRQPAQPGGYGRPPEQPAPPGGYGPPQGQPGQIGGDGPVPGRPGEQAQSGPYDSPPAPPAGSGAQSSAPEHPVPADDEPPQAEEPTSAD